jgi:hypothetical protein
MCVTNSYSVAFSLFIPIDKKFSTYSKELAAEFTTMGFKSPQNLGSLTDRPFEKSRLVDSWVSIDLKYLNETGRIKSSRQWNHGMSRYPGAEYSKIMVYEGKHFPTVQGIVSECRDFLKSGLKK